MSRSRERRAVERRVRQLAQQYRRDGWVELLLDPERAEAVSSRADRLRLALTGRGVDLGTRRGRRVAAAYLGGMYSGYCRALGEQGIPVQEQVDDELVALALVAHEVVARGR